MFYILAGVVGVAIGILLVVIFSKNNKNTIAKARQEILDAVTHGKTEVEKVLDRVTK
jgi:hypothetical protein